MAQSFFDFLSSFFTRTPSQPVSGMERSPRRTTDIELSSKDWQAQYPKWTPELSYTIQRIANSYGIDPDLFDNLIRHESGGYNSDAVSKSGAQGLGQLMPRTAKELGVKNPFNPEQNLQASAKYLSQKLAEFNNDPELALAAYNMGATKLRRYLRNGIPLPKETLNHRAAILNRQPPAPQGNKFPTPYP